MRTKRIPLGPVISELTLTLARAASLEWQPGNQGVSTEPRNIRNCKSLMEERVHIEWQLEECSLRGGET